MHSFDRHESLILKASDRYSQPRRLLLVSRSNIIAVPHRDRPLKLWNDGHRKPPSRQLVTLYMRILPIAAGPRDGMTCRAREQVWSHSTAAVDYYLFAAVKKSGYNWASISEERRSSTIETKRPRPSRIRAGGNPESPLSSGKYPKSSFCSLPCSCPSRRCRHWGTCLRSSHTFLYRFMDVGA